MSLPEVRVVTKVATRLADAQSERFAPVQLSPLLDGSFVTHHTDDTRDAQQILDAMRQIQNSPALQAEAATSPESVLDRLNLSGVARHAVALGIAGLLVAPVAVRPAMWWV